MICDRVVSDAPVTVVVSLRDDGRAGGPCRVGDLGVGRVCDAASSRAAAVASGRSEMATFVLVHGGWSGAHGYRHVRRLLQASRHDVFTPSLTGIGERAHLTSPQVNLTTHVRDVVNVVLYEDLNDIVLLRSSYGGFVVTGAVEHIAGRVRHLVFLDAFVPGKEDTVNGLAGRGASGPINVGDDWLVPPPTRHFDDEAEAAFINARRTPHPIGCFTEPLKLSQPLEHFPFERTFIRATADAPDAPGTGAFTTAAARAQRSPAWHYHEISTNHMVASNRPHELTELLLSLA